MTLSGEKSLTVRHVGTYLGYKSGLYQAEYQIGLFQARTDGGLGNRSHQLRAEKLRREGQPMQTIVCEHVKYAHDVTKPEQQCNYCTKEKDKKVIMKATCH